ncbi:hypothetical protein B0T10DRAFT_584288 [Thelonectria olida]|uniref:Uncharacterized protein n=1 Tax=Thelonectria olida TaxID=1576542 RepID=A0A9P8VVD0_9HYPO|nr:hypothetical protein B0T10DRAFT_584288 [Thelonectria olida]
MEALAGAATVLQLVQTVGKTALQVSQAYADIRGMDEMTHDFDSQLEATRFQLSVIEGIIERGDLSESMKAWWTQTDIKGLLSGCQRTYERLMVIFTKIARQRSSAAAVRSYIKLKRYDGDISHLRLCINTYTSALQLPVLIQSIFKANQKDPSTSQVQSQHISDEEQIRLLSDLGKRMTDLENSMTRAQQDLMARVRERDEVASSKIAGMGSLEDTLRGLKLEISNLTASQPNLHSVDAAVQKNSQPDDEKESLHSPQEENDADTRGALEIEDDTRAMLSKTKHLINYTRDYASTLDTLSLTSGSHHLRSRNGSPERTENEGLDSLLSGALLGLPVTHRQKQSVASWVAGVETADAASVPSLPPNLKRESAPSVTDASTTTSGNTGLTTISSQSLVGELHQRRLQAVHTLVKAKEFKKTIPHLERLLEADGDEKDEEQKDLLTRLLGKALHETDAAGHETGRLCEKFPGIRDKLNGIRLEEARKLMDRNEFNQVIQLLRQYRLHETASQEQTIVRRSDPEAGSNVDTLVKLRIILSSALIQSGVPGESLPMLGWVVAQPGLQPIQKANAHSLLAEVYCSQRQWENATSHGMQSVQLNMDALGRDHEFTSASIVLMIYICYETSNPDEDLWRDMLPAGTQDAIASLPSAVNSVQSCCFYMRVLVPQFKLLAAMVGDRYLFSCFELDISPASFLTRHYREVCRECIWAHLLEGQGSLLAFKQGATCPNHTDASRTGLETSPTSPRLAGLTPLHFLAIARPRALPKGDQQPKSCVEVIKTLLAPVDSKTRSRILNARANIHDEQGGTPLWYAVAYGHKEVVDYLLSLKETEKGDVETAQLLVRTLPDLMAAPRYADSIVAAFNALPLAIAHEILLSAAHSPLSELPWCFQHRNLLEALLPRFCVGPEMELGTVQTLFNIAIKGIWVLSYTAKGSASFTSLDDSAILETLLRHGADPNATTDADQTGMDYRVTRLMNAFENCILGGFPHIMLIGPEMPDHHVKVLQVLVQHGGRLNDGHKVMLNHMDGALPSHGDLEAEAELISKLEAQRNLGRPLLPSLRILRLWWATKRGGVGGMRAATELALMANRDFREAKSQNLKMMQLREGLQNLLGPCSNVVVR